MFDKGRLVSLLGDCVGVFKKGWSLGVVVVEVVVVEEVDREI